VRDLLAQANRTSTKGVSPARLGSLKKTPRLKGAIMTEAVGNETELNRRTIRKVFKAWEEGHRPITDVFAADMVWRIEGHSAASGRYESAQQFIDEVLTPFGARFASGEAFRPTEIRSIHADADTVIVVWDGGGTANSGDRYANSYAWIMKMRGGKVVDGTAFYDSISFNDLWARVQSA
jgi:ketosteroid isomerase-like protein